MDNYSIQLCLLAFTAVGVLATAIGIWISHKDEVKNQRVELYATYTKRYQEILIRQQEAIDKYGEDPDNQEVQFAFHLYFDLCCEEFYLYDHGYIHPDLWKDWLDGMKADFNESLCRKVWETQKDCYDSSRPFFENTLMNRKSH